MRPCRATAELRQKEYDRKNEARRKAYAADPSKRLEENRLWKRSNPDKVRINNRRRKAKIEGSFTHLEVLLILEEQASKCPGCLNNFSDVLPWTIDHFIPVNKGGTNSPDNIQLLCLSCNSSKRDTNWKDWINGNVR